MKILFVVPPNQFTLTRIPSLGPAWLAGYLRGKTDYDVKLLDGLRLSSRSYDSYLEEILQEKADIVGFSLFSRDIPVVARMSQALKEKNSETIIVTGGAHVSALPQHTLKKLPYVDFGIAGEGEVPFYKLCQELESGSNNFASVPGLVWRECDEVKANDQYFEEEMDSLGFPAWDLISPATYPHQPHGVVSRKSLVAPIFATRGCPYRCTYCGAHKVTGYPIRKRSIPHVIGEMEFLHQKYNVEEFHIEDDNFTLFNEYAIEFCEEVIKRGHKWKLALPNGVRLNSLNPPLIKLMARAGFYSFAVGIESATPRLLEVLKRAITVETMKEKLEMVAANSNIQVVGYAFLGIPTETEAEMEATIQFLLDVPLSRIGLGWCNALPGTELFNDLVRERKVDLDTFDFSLLDVYMDMPIDITSVGMKRVKEKIAEANRRFYFRPIIVWQLILNIKSFTQLWNVVATGMRRLFTNDNKKTYLSEGWYAIHSEQS